MKVERTAIPDVLLLEPTVFGDERGFFLEAWNKTVFDDCVGRPVDFVQDNHSRSAAGVLRGLHYQLPNPQGKLVRVTSGAVVDVAVDLRRSSPTFGRSVQFELSADNFLQAWVPEGFAHGFYVVDGPAEVQYKTTTFYEPDGDRVIRWDDPTLAVSWPLSGGSPALSAKDASAPFLADAPLFD